MTEKFEMLKVETIDFDTDNPRIKKALEKYGDRLNAERIHFALRSATEESNGASSYNRLRVQFGPTAQSLCRLPSTTMEREWFA